MKKLFSLILTFFFLAPVVYSQQSQLADFFPLTVGNVYKYRQEVPIPCLPPSISYYKMRIVKDTIAFGKRYFKIDASYRSYHGWFRFDSTNGNVLQFFPGNGCSQYPNDKIYDSLASSLGNVYSGCLIGLTNLRQCVDTSNFTIFGITMKSKKFNRTGAYTTRPRYVKGIGMVTEEGGEPDICNYITLLGCYVNGVLYGDTILTNIPPISSEFPDKHSLFQNYPNPFNTMTKIKFSIPQSKDGMKNAETKFDVYDISGRKVETLVKEALQPGTYEVTFDAGGLSSGVYFYRLEAGNYTETKRMVLLK